MASLQSLPSGPESGTGRRWIEGAVDRLAIASV
jgi:hypothetical protein